MFDGTASREAVVVFYVAIVILFLSLFRFVPVAIGPITGAIQSATIGCLVIGIGIMFILLILVLR